VPPALSLFVTAMDGLGVLAWRGRRNREAAFAAA